MLNPSISSDPYSTSIPSNPNAQEGVKSKERGSDAAYIGAAVVLSLGASQIGGAIAAVANAVNGIWNAVQATRVKIEQTFIKSSLAKHQALALEKPNDKTIQQEIQRLQDLMSGNEAQMDAALEGLKQNARHFVSSLISIVPLVGVIGAGAFLNVTAKEGESKSPTAVQRGAEEIMKGATSALGSVARDALYPLGGKGTTLNDYYKEKTDSYNKFGAYGRTDWSIEDVRELDQIRLNQLGAKEIHIPVERGDGQPHNIRCQFINTNHDPSAETVVIFHGNGMIGEEMNDAAQVYKDQGKNVVMMTMGGYPGSDERVSTSEVSTIQDVNAILKHLEQQGVKTIGVHGHSIGGTLAMHATQLSDKVKYCCFDKSLDSARNVAANLITNLEQEVPILKMIPKAVVRGFIGTGFPTGQQVPGVKSKDGKPYTTDGCDNLDKAGKYNGVLVTISGNKDQIMGSKPDDTGTFKENFPQDLHKAHAAKNKSKSFDCVVDLGHNCSPAGAERAINQGLEAAFRLSTA